VTEVTGPDDGPLTEGARVAGVLLAAGSGRRFGKPKALVELGGQALAARAAGVLRDGGCDPVLAVIGAAADEVRATLPAGVEPVVAAGYESGMGASLAAGVEAVLALDPRPTAALVHLVDMPAVGPAAIRRVVSRATTEYAIARASYGARPGNPVLFGYAWLPELSGHLGGDEGARSWLRARSEVALVECGDVGDPSDVDTPHDLTRGVTLGLWTT
jgi:nicotine blue oxidoreductase